MLADVVSFIITVGNQMVKLEGGRWMLADVVMFHHHSWLLHITWGPQASARMFMCAIVPV